MATRRPVHRNRQSQPTSRKGLKFCILLAATILLVPLGGDLVRAAKMKVRDLVLKAGLVDLNECVVTPAQAIACTSDAVGTPLQAALRQMQDVEMQAAAEKKQRLKAESAARQLAVELDQLTKQMAQGQLAERAVRSFPPIVGDVMPTARTGDSVEAANASPSVPADNAAMPAANDDAETGGNDASSFSLTPPNE